MSFVTGEIRQYQEMILISRDANIVTSATVILVPPALAYSLSATWDSTVITFWSYISLNLYFIKPSKLQIYSVMEVFCVYFSLKAG